ncbi:unnamed protein product [Coregonus sp. 'balchen']|nr:unnamed protein product [Coregonus sp. 'balchen']
MNASTDLRLLDCTHNQLESIPPILSLDQLCLSQNKLLFLPELSSSRLKMRILMVKSVPEEITELHGLERLDLINNDISSLPAALGLLSKLKILTLEGNPLRRIHRDLLTKGTNEMLKYLRGQIKEDPYGNGDDPDTAMTLPSQAKINVYAIKTLKTLDYSDKQALCVPDDVFNAMGSEPVASVNFRKNQPAAVPPRYSAYINEGLDFNKLTSLPLEFCMLQQLANIGLRFKLFPEVLYQVPTLETILISSNKVGAIDPLQLKALDKLSTLDLQNNDIMQVPPELGNCTSLGALMLDGNPLRNP